MVSVSRMGMVCAKMKLGADSKTANNILRTKEEMECNMADIVVVSFAKLRLPPMTCKKMREKCFAFFAKRPKCKKCKEKNRLFSYDIVRKT